MTKTVTAIRPTEVAYSGLDAAHAFFNRELFDDKLPPALIRLHSHANSYGYFCGKRFERAHGADEGHIDEIAINPMHVAERSVDKTLSTLVHEMVHQWQAHLGTEPTRCYHDKQWAAKMKEVGLYPSDTAAPGGKETGAKVSHYIIPAGRFAIACAAFLADHDAVLYQDRARALVEAGGKIKGVKGKAKKGGDDDGESGEEPAKKSKGRAKYTCPKCELNAWARPKANLRCGDCNIALACDAG